MSGPSIARETSVCSAPGCLKIIYPGSRIIRTGRGAWRHADCSAAGRWWPRRKAGGFDGTLPALTGGFDGDRSRR